MFNNWHEGYVSEVDYTYNYFPEMSPVRLKFILLLNGFDTNNFKNACELGFGQGLNIACHSTTTDINWYGNDFNPSHVSFASKLLAESNTRAKLYDDSFSEFINNPDLPMFDYIALHGVWSWISNENRDLIVKFLKEKLNAGGVVYLSYNMLAGHNDFVPIRKLLRYHFETLQSGDKSLEQKIELSLQMAADFVKTSPKAFSAYPNLLEKIEKLQEHENKSYIAHEYFNLDWHCETFSDISATLANTKLVFVTSADLIDNFDIVNLDEDQQKFFSLINDNILKQTLFDQAIGRTFRRDYWQRGARKLNPYELEKRILDTKIVLIKDITDDDLKLSGYAMAADLNKELYLEISKILSNVPIISCRDLFSKLNKKVVTSFPSLKEALQILTAKNIISPLSANAYDAEVIDKCRSYNKLICEKSNFSKDIKTLASPITGGGITIHWMYVLFTDAVLQGKRLPSDWAAHAWESLKARNIKFVEDGETVMDDKENLQKINDFCIDFEKIHVPLLKRLGII